MVVAAFQNAYGELVGFGVLRWVVIGHERLVGGCKKGGIRCHRNSGGLVLRILGICRNRNTMGSVSACKVQVVVERW